MPDIQQTLSNKLEGLSSSRVKFEEKVLAGLRAEELSAKQCERLRTLIKYVKEEDADLASLGFEIFTQACEQEDDTSSDIAEKIIIYLKLFYLINISQHIEVEYTAFKYLSKDQLDRLFNIFDKDRLEKKYLKKIPLILNDIQGFLIAYAGEETQKYFLLQQTFLDIGNQRRDAGNEHNNEKIKNFSFTKLTLLSESLKLLHPIRNKSQKFYDNLISIISKLPDENAPLFKKHTALFVYTLEKNQDNESIDDVANKIIEYSKIIRLINEIPDCSQTNFTQNYIFKNLPISSLEDLSRFFESNKGKIDAEDVARITDNLDSFMRGEDKPKYLLEKKLQEILKEYKLYNHENIQKLEQLDLDGLKFLKNILDGFKYVLKYNAQNNAASVFDVLIPHLKNIQNIPLTEITKLELLIKAEKIDFSSKNIDLFFKEIRKNINDPLGYEIPIQDTEKISVASETTGDSVTENIEKIAQLKKEILAFDTLKPVTRKTTFFVSHKENKEGKDLKNALAKEHISFDEVKKALSDYNKSLVANRGTFSHRREDELCEFIKTISGKNDLKIGAELSNFINGMNIDHVDLSQSSASPAIIRGHKS